MIDYFVVQKRRTSKTQNWFEYRQTNIFNLSPIPSQMKNQSNYKNQKNAKNPSQNCHFFHKSFTLKLTCLGTYDVYLFTWVKLNVHILGGDFYAILYLLFRTKRDRQLANRSQMRYFKDVAGYEGIFLCGPYPHWLMLTVRGELRSHPMGIDSSIPCFASFHNVNCPQGRKKSVSFNEPLNSVFFQASYTSIGKVNCEFASFQLTCRMTLLGQFEKFLCDALLILWPII